MSERQYTVGDTVRLQSRVSSPGEHTPVDPTTVSLTALVKIGGGTVPTTLPVALTRVREGEYTLNLSTTSFTPGTYKATVTHASGSTQVVQASDQFVLVAP